MNKLVTTIVTLTLVLALSLPAVARKPAGALISSAKIEIVSGDLDRYKEAEKLLQEAFDLYGPIAEGLFLLNQMQIDYIERTADPNQKREYARAMVKWQDSLRTTCNNEEVRDKYREDCDEYLEQADSSASEYWREFYNIGVGQLEQFNKARQGMAQATDSANAAFYEKQVEAFADSAVTNLQIATILDPEDYRPYVGISQVYENIGMYDSAGVFLEKGLEYSEDRTNLLLPVAYNYINSGDFCGAIPTLKEYVETVPEDTANMINLAICYNRCEMYDSARMVYRDVLALDPDNLDALTSIGSYFNEMARYANDSATTYRDAEQSEKAEEWMEKRSEILDSSLFYFERAYEADSTDTYAVENYGLIAFVQNEYQDAIRAYTQLTRLEPQNVDAWLSIGDAHIQLKEFVSAIEPYEKVIEMEPDNKEIVERLVDLHKEAKNPDMVEKYQQMLAEME